MESITLIKSVKRETTTQVDFKITMKSLETALYAKGYTIIPTEEYEELKMGEIKND